MAMVECPRCGAMVSDKAKKCVHCGEVLIPEEKKYCMECGAELIEGMSECLSVFQRKIIILKRTS